MEEQKSKKPARREVLQAAAKLPYVAPVVLAAVQARARPAPVSAPSD